MLIHWHGDPIAFHLGPLAVRWYGLLFATAFVAGYELLRWMCRKENRSFEPLKDLLIWIMIGGLVGARLAHCLIYEPALYLSHPIEILKIWQGGLASHGGVVGVILTLFFYSRRADAPPLLWLCDRMTLPATLAGALIRIGNFMNSEILGRPTGAAWGVVFERVDSIARHPVQLYEAAAYLLLFGALLGMYRRWQEHLAPGIYTGVFLVGVFTARFLLEFVKMPQAAYDSQLALSVGQWLSLPFIVAGIILIVLKRRSTAAG